MTVGGRASGWKISRINQQSSRIAYAVLDGTHRSKGHTFLIRIMNAAQCWARCLVVRSMCDPCFGPPSVLRAVPMLLTRFVSDPAACRPFCFAIDTVFRVTCRSCHLVAIESGDALRLAYQISHAAGRGRGRDPSSCVLSIADDPKRSSVIDRRRPQTNKSLQVPVQPYGIYAVVIGYTRFIPFTSHNCSRC